jgi:creatinine amidohydrolase
VQFGEQTWKEIADLTDRVVLLPLASCEQHGHHLPLLTDTIICQEIVSRVEAELGDIALFLPTLWMGASDHHRAFSGTVSLSNDVYKQVLMDVLESLISSGFQRIFLLSAHGGNHIPGCSAIYEVQLRHKNEPDLWIAFGEWMTIAGKQIAELKDIEQSHVIHACEIETSMILCLQPMLVKMEAVRGAKIPFESAFYCPDFSRSSRVNVPRSFEQLSETGAFGLPELATAEKGKLVFDVAVNEIVAFMREFATWSCFDPQ